MDLTKLKQLPTKSWKIIETLFFWNEPLLYTATFEDSSELFLFYSTDDDEYIVSSISQKTFKRLLSRLIDIRTAVLREPLYIVSGFLIFEYPQDLEERVKIEDNVVAPGMFLHIS